MLEEVLRRIWLIGWWRRLGVFSPNVVHRVDFVRYHALALLVRIMDCEFLWEATFTAFDMGQAPQPCPTWPNGLN